MLRRGLAILTVSMAVVVSVGCAGKTSDPGGTVPDSASLAPADALAYASVTTDESSDQWKAAEQLIDRIPGARDQLVGEVADELQKEGLTWKDDVAPALGPEMVVVVTADGTPISLWQPKDEARLEALIAKSDEPVAHTSVNGWEAFAEHQSDLVSYKAALSRGSLAADDRLSAGFAALPSEALGRVWVDLGGLMKSLRVLPVGTGQVNLGVQWLSAALVAQDDGIKVAVGTRTPEGGGTQYEPKLFDQVPADSVAALSFGGTQSTVDKLEDRIPLHDITQKIESVTGVSLGGILDAFSGEGVVYVRRGDSIPEVTLVLAPPDVDKTFETVSQLAQNLARQAGTTVESATEDGRQVEIVHAQGVTVRYARLDDAVIVTTGARGITDFAGDGSKLTSTDDFQRAANEVGLEGRTGGFAYIDVDGLLPLIDDSGKGSSMPAEARNVVQSLDSFILESSADGDVTTLTGVLRLND